MQEGVRHIGRMLFMAGIIIAAVGAILMLGSRISWLGRLPGDILIEKKNFTFYFPLATSIIVSLLLTLVFCLLGRR